VLVLVLGGSTLFFHEQIFIQWKPSIIYWNPINLHEKNILFKKSGNMSEVSIIELIVYGLIGYPAIIFLIASSFKESTGTASKISVVKAIWIIVPIIAMYMLASAGAQINFIEQTTLNYNVTSNTLVSNSTITDTVTLVNPVWVTLHWMMFMVLILYFMWNMLRLFTQRD